MGLHLVSLTLFLSSQSSTFHGEIAVALSNFKFLFIQAHCVGPAQSASVPRRHACAILLRGAASNSSSRARTGHLSVIRLLVVGWTRTRTASIYNTGRLESFQPLGWRTTAFTDGASTTTTVRSASPGPMTHSRPYTVVNGRQSRQVSTLRGKDASCVPFGREEPSVVI